MNRNIVYSVDDNSLGTECLRTLGKHQSNWKEYRPNISFLFLHSFLDLSLPFLPKFSICFFFILSSCHPSFFFVFPFPLKQQELLSALHHFPSFPSFLFLLSILHFLFPCFASRRTSYLLSGSRLHVLSPPLIVVI